MKKEYAIDRLIPDSVSVRTQQYTVIDDKEYPIGQLHRKAYVNSIRGRQEVQEELLQEQQNAIFAIWGDIPAVDESIAQ